MSELDDLGDPQGDGEGAGTAEAGALDRPGFISEEGWEGLPDADKDLIRRDRQRTNDLKKNFQGLASTVARLEGKLEGLTAAGAGKPNGNGNGQKTVAEYTEQELKSFLSEANRVREAYRANPEDEKLKQKYALLGDGELEEDARIELAARRAELRSGKKFEDIEKREAAQTRAQAFHKRLLGVVGPQLMSEMVGGNGSLKDDHPIVQAARERTQEMLAERGIDPKNEDAVFVVIERAFEEVAEAQRGRGGSGRESARGRLEMAAGHSSDPAQRGRANASVISTLLRRGKVAEAHEASLLDYLTTGREMPPEFRVPRARS
ncbi:MAG: hypothetical protein FJ109_20290 [Deltaproteobacteria bacterium]|nr:hypothetical protein [Deltaproteobacteria bacterium]